jgi:hypothetical protein
VKSAYLAAVEYASPSDIAELQRFLSGLEGVDVLADNVAAASEIVSRKSAAPPLDFTADARVLAFRGHGRALLEREAPIKAWIRSQVEAEVAAVGKEKVRGIAGGCCGGDILFHEICQEMGIPAHMYLPFTADQFVPQFVQADDPQWIERFRRLTTTIPVSMLQASPQMPRWLKDRDAYTFVQRWNSWMLSVARSTGAEVTAIGICDETRADDEGVVDFIQKARQTGVKPILAHPAKFQDAL